MPFKLNLRRYPATIYEEHARDRERRAAALAEDKDAQKTAFHRRQGLTLTHFISLN